MSENENWTVSTGVWTTSMDNCPWFTHKCSTLTYPGLNSSFAIVPQAEIEVPILRGEIEDALAGRCTALRDIPPEKLAKAKRLAEELVEAKAEEEGVELSAEDREKIASLIILIAKKTADNVE
jgi:hypothetical protein